MKSLNTMIRLFKKYLVLAVLPCTLQAKEVVYRLTIAETYDILGEVPANSLTKFWAMTVFLG